ncbi:MULTISPECIES: hypothetical protein [unclassified Paenibacillus]|uniref:hypothetical protein n=1 Tax=unclassified Paenibacillus TaxID=185978 RepID=UPI00362CF385
MTEHTKKLGILNIDSDIEEDSGNITISLTEDNFIEVCVSQTHKYGMTAEIELNIVEFQRVTKALEQARNLIFNDVFHRERFAVDTIYVNGISSSRQGMIIVNVFEESIILVVSLTHGGDPDIMINKQLISELIKLFQTAEASIN